MCYSWEVLKQGEFEGLFDLVRVQKPKIVNLTKEELFKLCGLEKFGTNVPSSKSAHSRQCAVITATTCEQSMR